METENYLPNEENSSQHERNSLQNEANTPLHEETTKKIVGGKGMMNGATGRLYSKENQPSGEAKSKGIKKKQALKQLLKLTTAGNMLGESTKDYALMAATYFGIDVLDITVRMIMDYRQIEKAILRADTPAYEAVMKRAYGNPNQPLSGDPKNPLMPSEYKVVHVQSDIPLAESEDEVNI